MSTTRPFAQLEEPPMAPTPAGMNPRHYAALRLCMNDGHLPGATPDEQPCAYHRSVVDLVARTLLAADAPPPSTHVVVIHRGGRAHLAVPYPDEDTARGVHEQIAKVLLPETSVARLASADVARTLHTHAREADTATNAAATAENSAEQAYVRLSECLEGLTLDRPTPTSTEAVSGSHGAGTMASRRDPSCIRADASPGGSDG